MASTEDKRSKRAELSKLTSQNSKNGSERRPRNKCYVVGRLAGVFVALFLGWRLKWPLGSQESIAAVFVKHLPRVPSPVDGEWPGNFTLKQVLDELGVGIDKFMDEVPAIKSWMERETATESLLIDHGLADMTASNSLEPKHPVIIIPGVTNTPLVLYQGKECASAWLRNRLWGSITSTAHLFSSNSSCYLEHLSLDDHSGLDPDGIRLRATQDLGDIETVFGLDMWKWTVDRLVSIGYDSNMVTAMTYDWRLAADDVETRDGYFSRLRLTIEFNFNFHKQKVAIFTHSFGGNLLHHFLAWVEATAGQGWTETHVAVIAAIGVPHLGVPKALAALLSGETKDTVGLGGWGVRMGDMLLPRKQRIPLLRSYGSIINMLPKGGNAVWGSLDSAEDNDAIDSSTKKCTGPNPEGAKTAKPGVFLTVTWNNGTVTEMDMETSSKVLLEKVPSGVRNRIQRHGALLAGIDGFQGSSQNFADVVSTPLPTAPSLRYLCLYGTGVPTERRYHYREYNAEQGLGEESRESGTDMTIDASVDHADHCTSNGVSHGNGDGSVPLTSLGLMCRKWSEPGHLNPSGIKFTTVEFPHIPVVPGPFSTGGMPRFDLRGGPEAVDHLDIMGNEKMLRLLLMAASGKADMVEEKVTSDIAAIANKIKLQNQYESRAHSSKNNALGKNSNTAAAKLSLSDSRKDEL